MWWIIIGLFFLLIFIIILLTKITVQINFHHEQDNDQLTVQLRAWFGLIRYTIDVPLVKVNKNTGSVVVKEKTKMSGSSNNKEKDKDYSPKDIFYSIRDTYELVRHVVGMHEIARRFLSRVEIKQFEWHSNLGVGDAAYTGVLTGFAWSVKGGIIGFMSQYTRLQAQPFISVTPYFQQKASQTLFKCMIRFQIGNAMLAGIRTVKYWKGGRPKFKTQPLAMFSKDSENESM
ncbi:MULTISPECIES: DUF2953 domain-containing protein [Bacillus]|uniref:DUF2953 domain-containing protein n=1 Tax=Bacillus TaxID=1386 RepID=UPI000BB8DF1C|nr:MULTISPECIES: DUF2953 domain-containing protein [Bacillus]